MRTPTATIELVVSSDGTQIAYQRSGSGPPLVLAHGTSGDRTSFRLVEPLLARRFTVCAVDRRGRGRSGDSGDGYRIEQEFADIAAVVDSLAREIRAEERHRPDPDAFAALSVPAKLLLGSESPEWARRGTEIVRSLLPDSHVVVLEGQGHVATMTAPELPAGEVVRFLRHAETKEATR